MNEGACVIVGAGPGNGAAIGAEFAAAGYRVALCARDKKRLNEMAEKIRGASTYAYDVKDTAAAPEVFARIRQEMGPVNVLIYNAGAGAFANIDDATLEDFQSAWEVNCRDLFLTVKEALPDMRATGKGSIVIIGATASIKGGANFAPFASAKAGQRGLSQSLARYLGSAEQILGERVAGKIGMITRRATKVVAGTTMPRSATPWVPDFTTTQVGPGFAGGLLCQAPREGVNHSRRRLSRIPPSPPPAKPRSRQRRLVQRFPCPEGIHVSYVILDGVINLQRTRQRMPDKADEFFLEPAQIAKTVFFLAQQPPQAWSFELDLRPFGEKW